MTDSATTLAAAARKALRAATKTAGDVLQGLMVSVRVSRASMCTAIDVRVTGVNSSELVRSEEEQRDGAGCWTVLGAV